jgi:hypothetical protein
VLDHMAASPSGDQVPGRGSSPPDLHSCRKDSMFMSDNKV